MSAEMEDLYVVIPRKYVSRLPQTYRTQLMFILEKVHLMRQKEGESGPSPKYYACRQDEPYAGAVKELILRSEELKKRGRWG